jgi:hypothetical protein
MVTGTTTGAEGEEGCCCALLGCNPNKQAPADMAKPVPNVEIRTMSPVNPAFCPCAGNLPSSAESGNLIAKFQAKMPFGVVF